eukprot:scaffold1102_cov256-Pinguiococcus_pyrenoidosus.AAC.51
MHPKPRVVDQMRQGDLPEPMFSISLSLSRKGEMISRDSTASYLISPRFWDASARLEAEFCAGLRQQLVHAGGHRDFLGGKVLQSEGCGHGLAQRRHLHHRLRRHGHRGVEVRKSHAKIRGQRRSDRVRLGQTRDRHAAGVVGVHETPELGNIVGPEKSAHFRGKLRRKAREKWSRCDVRYRNGLDNFR